MEFRLCLKEESFDGLTAPPAKISRWSAPGIAQYGGDWKERIPICDLTTSAMRLTVSITLGETNMPRASKPEAER